MGERSRRRRLFRTPTPEPEAEAEAAAEVDFHLSMRERDLVSSGLPASEARRRAALEFGDVNRIRRELNRIGRKRARRRAVARVLEPFTLDVRFGARALWKRPGVPIVAVLTVALGIGASVMIYSAGRKLIADALPFPAADRVVTAERTGEGGRWLVGTYGDYLAWSSAVERLATLSAYTQMTSFVGDGEQTFRVAASGVTGEYFAMLGISPLRGRTFAAGEVSADEAVAVITERLWATRFGRADDIVGRSIHIDGRVHTIIGVVPRGYQYPASVDLWTPLRSTGDDIASRSVSVLGRLHEDAGADAVRAALAPVQRALDETRPAEERTARIDVAVLSGRPNDQAVIATWLLQGTVLVLLLIASTNAAGLMLTRAMDRRREIAVRTSLGASRARVVRQLLVESMFLAVAAGGLGVLVAHTALRVLRDGLPVAMTRSMMGWERLGLDTHALLFAVLLATASGILFGLVPALRVVRGDLGVHLRDGAPTTARGREGSRAARVLLAGEVALALTFLLSGGLLTRSLIALRSADPGFDAADVLAVEWALPPNAPEGTNVIAAFHDPVVQRLEALPGVRSATIVSNLPMSRTGSSRRYRVRGGDPDAEPASASWRPATAGYLEMMGIALRRGRHFEGADGASAARVAIVSEALAQRAWGDGVDPVGRQIDVEDQTWTVVGVAEDVHNFGVQQRAEPTIYVPQAQAPTNAGFLAIGTAGDPPAHAARVRGEIWAVDPDVAIGDVQPLTGMIADFYADERILAVLMTVFATVALFITVVSLYTLVAHAVARRRHEFGIRLALGAQPRHVVVEAMSQGFVWVGAGILVGLILAAGIARVLAAELYGIRPFDPVVFALVPGGMIVVAFIASFLPAQRATAVSPVETLRGG